MNVKARQEGWLLRRVQKIWAEFRARELPCVSGLCPFLHFPSPILPLDVEGHEVTNDEPSFSSFSTSSSSIRQCRRRFAGRGHFLDLDFFLQPGLSKLHEDARSCSKDFQQVWYELEMFKVCRARWFFGGVEKSTLFHWAIYNTAYHTSEVAPLKWGFPLH